jgi:hypothetical protein
VQVGKCDYSGLARQHLKSALCVSDASHAQKPHKKVESVHEKCSVGRPLWLGRKTNIFINTILKY